MSVLDRRSVPVSKTNNIYNNNSTNSINNNKIITYNNINNNNNTYYDNNNIAINNTYNKLEVTILIIVNIIKIINHKQISSGFEPRSSMTPVIWTYVSKQ